MLLYVAFDLEPFYPAHPTRYSFHTFFVCAATATVPPPRSRAGDKTEHMHTYKNATDNTRVCDRGCCGALEKKLARVIASRSHERCYTVGSHQTNVNASSSPLAHPSTRRYTLEKRGDMLSLHNRTFMPNGWWWSTLLPHPPQRSPRFQLQRTARSVKERTFKTQTHFCEWLHALKSYGIYDDDRERPL